MQWAFRSVFFAALALALCGLAQNASAQAITVTSAAAARAQVVLMFATAATRYNAPCLPEFSRTPVTRPPVPGTPCVSDADRAAIVHDLANQLAAFAVANPQFANDIANAVMLQPDSRLRTAVLNALPDAFSTASIGTAGQAAALSFLNSMSANVQAGVIATGGGRAAIVLSPH
ncbi:hypothetical protein ABLE91_06620 [Aquabacter sp. CN5-332]